MSSLQETIWENISSQPLKLSLVGKYYKLKEWPNFGFSKYSPDFIVLSANLSKRSYSKSELIKTLQIDENIINHFLNASSLLQLLEVSDTNELQETHNHTAVSKFTRKLKKLFNF